MAVQYYNCACLLLFIFLQLVDANANNVSSVLDGCQDGQNCTQSGKFLCKVSGKWIDRKLLCDFGRDCGPLDDSDEADCSEYEGRCDFEKSDQCGWIATNSSWLRLGTRAPPSAAQQDQAPKGGEPRSQPRLDHTYQSDGQDGHFMLLDVEHLEEFKFAQLIGPRVQLKPGHHQCNIRFWLSTQVKMGQLEQPMDSPYLIVGFDHVRSNELFKGELGQNGWRRFELVLFQRGLERAPIYTLHFNFGNFSKTDLLKFSQNDGYLALDDLSFTPGCQLSYYEYEDNTSICPQSQFRCSVAPAETPETYCVPENRVCDFKPDCGTDPKTKLASDERGCPKECRLDDGSSSALSDCGLEIIDFSKTTILEKELNRPIWYIHAFEVNFLKEKIQGLQFMSQLEQFENNKSVVPRDNTTLKVELNNSTLSWPSFSQAHANCTLQLDYAFSPDAHNLVAFINVVTGNTSESIYYGTIFPHSRPDKEVGSRHLFEVGLGQHRSPFRVQLEIEALVYGQDKFAGSFTLFGYKFVHCQYPAGLLDVLKSPIVMKTGDDQDDDEEEAQQFEGAHRNSSAASLSCPKDQFQCHSPILCLPESLRCDMQIDCQDSAIDELNCGKSGAQQYNFEKDTIGEAPAGWVNEQAQVASALWKVSRHKRWDRIDYNSGPPVDHTAKSSFGKFLVLFPRQPETDPDSVQGLIYTPTMKLKANCKRVVFYFYYWQGALRRKTNSAELKVFIQRTHVKDAQLLYVLPPEEVSERDWWQRVELQLPQTEAENQFTNGSGTAANEEHFRLAFLGRLHGIKLHGDLRHPKVQGRDSIFAIDDVSFNVDCQPSAPSASSQLAEMQELALSMFEDSVQVLPEQKYYYIGRPFLMLLAIAFIVVAVATYINHRRSHPYGRIAKSESDQDEGLVMSRI